VRLVRLAIWLATSAFIVMLFYPLVREMFARLGGRGDTGFP
jgi:hypothetical protein